MKNLGDITKISGYDAPTVNVIIGGSPCQDLSVAGKRQGLAGARSGLFMEQIRIIKEMREKDAKAGRTGADVRPRFMVWENVPGAFSVNGGADFAAVLEETIRVAEPEAPDIPGPRKGWATAGCYMGDGWSVAWRVLDAQYWGVPQRRRRIALVADFGGQTAPEILFKPQSVSGHFEQSRKEGQTVTGNAEECTNESGERIVSVYDGARYHDYQPFGNVCETVQAKYGTGGGNTPIVVSGDSVAYGISAYASNSMKSDNPNSGIYLAETSRTLDITCANPACNQGGIAIVSETAGTLDASYCKGAGMRNGVEREIVAQVFNRQGIGEYEERDIESTKTAHIAKDVDDLVLAVNCRNGVENVTVNGTGYIARRLTPLECERLQGYPDGWTDIGEWIDSKGKKRITSDSARYKALGNSIAIPPWLWVCDQIGQYLGEDKTMASLFDGIGGYPLIWSYLFGTENCVWASEIEEFPIAVTKYRFPEVCDDQQAENHEPVLV